MVNDNQDSQKNNILKDNIELLDKKSLIKDINLKHDNVLSEYNIDFIGQIPVKVLVELGRIKITIKEFLKLSVGSILSLENDLNQPLNIFVNNFLIAQGEIVVIENKYGIRITKIIEKSEFINTVHN
ncbi:Flagellar motor switch protein FliN [Buchnera aphidicola (Eriosoma grossulariae)]|uniref:flagellar motor switch protein FliN n=1 Tax=Buchnera aphidicola TaxID=9 RepID=UPI003463B376